MLTWAAQHYSLPMNIYKKQSQTLVCAVAYHSSLIEIHKKFARVYKQIKPQSVLQQCSQ